MLTLGKDAIHRNYFEQDTEFPDNTSRLLDGYNKAARISAWSAKHAARTGMLKDIRHSQWCETVTATIEECLRLELYPDVDFSIPEPPSFDVE